MGKGVFCGMRSRKDWADGFGLGKPVFGFLLEIEVSLQKVHGEIWLGELHESFFPCKALG